LLDSEAKYKTIFESANDEIIYLDSEGTILEINDKCEELFGIKREEFIGKNFADFEYLGPEQMRNLLAQFKDISIKKNYEMEELEIRRRDGSTAFIEANFKVIERDNRVIGILAIIRDVTERKLVQKELDKYRRFLETLVMERTDSLEKANTALRIMLRQENEIKRELEHKILTNMKKLILPSLRKIKEKKECRKLRSYFDDIEMHLDDIISPFAHKLSANHYDLTPTQLRIADLLKQGKTTKEIAVFLNLSINTVHFHRTNIRKKVGIAKKKINLRTFLLSIG